VSSVISTHKFQFIKIREKNKFQLNKTVQQATSQSIFLSIKDRKASLSARREGIVVSQLKTVLNKKIMAYIVKSDFLLNAFLIFQNFSVNSMFFL
jgi:hypothetical protein